MVSGTHDIATGAVSIDGGEWAVQPNPDFETISLVGNANVKRTRIVGAVPECDGGPFDLALGRFCMSH